MRKLILLLATMLITCTLYGTAVADTWTIFTYNGGNPLADGSPGAMVYSLDNYQLSLNTSVISTIGGSSAMQWTLLSSGTWAGCGSIDENGRFQSDPYASFIAEGTGGHINWDHNTPNGYSTTLLLGKPFTGSGAETYTNQWGAPIGNVSACMVLNTHPSIRGSEYNLYDPVSHTFNVTFSPANSGAVVPEPTGLITLLSGCISVIGLRLKRNNH